MYKLVYRSDHKGKLVRLKNFYEKPFWPTYKASEDGVSFGPVVQVKDLVEEELTLQGAPST